MLQTVASLAVLDKANRLVFERFRVLPGNSRAAEIGEPHRCREGLFAPRLLLLPPPGSGRRAAHLDGARRCESLERERLRPRPPGSRSERRDRPPLATRARTGLIHTRLAFRERLRIDLRGHKREVLVGQPKRLVELQRLWFRDVIDLAVGRLDYLHDFIDADFEEFFP